jgi:hypothetical protein
MTNLYALETFSAFIAALYLGVATKPTSKNKKKLQVMEPNHKKLPTSIQERSW